jgi:hypothetical protein
MCRSNDNTFDLESTGRAKALLPYYIDVTERKKELLLPVCSD